MKYSFVNLYHNFTNHTNDKNLREAQRDCLYSWSQALRKSEIPYIEQPKVSFKSYKLNEYPDQTKIKNMIYAEYVNIHGELYWAGDKYENIDELYKDLSAQKRIMELIIEE